MNKYITGYFEIDHPILNFILISLGVMFAFCLFMCLIILPRNDCYKGSKIFEYEDINGNKGTASDCQYSDKEGRSGGQGQPICFVGKKVIAVKWYEDKTEYGSCAKIIFDN